MVISRLGSVVCMRSVPPNCPADEIHTQAMALTAG